MQEKNSAILFDLDGTLLNSGLTFHKIVNQLKKEINQEEVPFEKVRKYSSRGASLILKNSFPEADEAQLEDLKKSFLERYFEFMLDDICLYDGVVELIDFLANESIPWGIVTNKSEKYTRPIIEKLKWHELTNAVICPENVTKAKPDPEGIITALNLLNASNSESYYVGDHKRDVETGKNANVKTVACTYGFHETDPHSWQADYIINEPIELKNVI
jgi:2-phosphoglycolate phosphatase|tara:strand:+ start:6002 stop:6649 length:648 start_codon:yes stop_codon:yes gene_type:complete